ncbi:hypothetical protein HOLleu_19424 [Holothuria leucospilota]|uniref:Uncharacterized protein n=1 Tax=Holothuria leucospilota TaxID=206669 RepID=A0A9Q1BZN3_HOLLE|nr:hypothetical protein HOLleu_19424 [Holothuria leucospilota]
MRNKDDKMQISFFYTDSDSTVPSTVIFPKSSIAFLISQKDDILKEVSEKSNESLLSQEFIDRMDKFTKMHRNCYLVLKATPLDNNVWCAIWKIQQRFIDSRLQLIFAEKDMDCIQAMTTIAQATCKPTSTVLQSTLQQHLANQLTDGTTLRILQQTGLSEHDILFFCITVPYILICILNLVTNIT